MKFLVLGATGMAGHLISVYLSENGHELTTISRKPCSFGENIIADIRDTDMLGIVIKQHGFDAVINCVGILNKDAELNKDNAVFINSYLPHWLSNLTRNSGTKIVQMSTDCVFSGNQGNYHEDSLKDGGTFYDRSKALGEINNEKDLTFRNSIIGPDMKENGIGLYNWFMKQNGTIHGFHKAIWSGVTTITLAKAIEQAVKDNLSGVYHLVNNETINKYELLKLFNKHFRNNQLTINTSDAVIVDKSLINNRTDFNFNVPTYELMVKEMKQWVTDHKNLYPHYFK